MTTDSVRLRLKTPWVEVRYVGHVGFLNDHLLEVLERTAHLRSGLEELNANDSPLEIEHQGLPESEESVQEALAHTTISIASRLSVKTGPDLIVAAAAKLTLVDHRERFSRHELVTEMKAAAAYYKKTYNNNLTQYLQRLEKADRLRSGGKNLYALSTAERSSLHALLSEPQ